MQDYTLFETFVATQTFNIPAFGGKLNVSWNPESQVTQWGGLAYFVSYLKTSGLFDRLDEDKVGCCTLITNDEKLDAATLQQVYRDRGDCENNLNDRYCTTGVRAPSRTK